MNIRNLFLMTLAMVALAACTSKTETTETNEEADVAEATAAATTYSLDPNATEIIWHGENIVGKAHNGAIKVSEGTLNLEDGALVAGEFTIDMNSIEDHDIENPEYNAKLVGHLKSDDFFSVETFPTASFAITRVEEATDNADATHYIWGNLTMKDKTNEIKIPAVVSMEGDDLMAKADFAIDRSKWDVRYGSKTFFDDLGDELILNEIRLELNLVAHKGGNGATPATASAE